WHCGCVAIHPDTLFPITANQSRGWDAKLRIRDLPDSRATEEGEESHAGVAESRRGEDAPRAAGAADDGPSRRDDRRGRRARARLQRAARAGQGAVPPIEHA